MDEKMLWKIWNKIRILTEGANMSFPYEIHYYRGDEHFKTRQFYTLNDAKAESDFLKSMGYSHSLWHYSKLIESYR